MALSDPSFIRIFVAVFVLLPVWHSAFPAHRPDKSGVLVMAHGGGEEWNAAVLGAIAPLREHCPTEVAFGMAHRESLQQAVSKLEARGVSRIVVARLFVSGDSFREQTEYFLGLRSEPPEYFLVHPHSMDMSDSGAIDAAQLREMVVPSKHHPLQSIRSSSALVLTPRGLYDSPEIAQIVVERVRSLSRNPETESVLILAHGVGDDRMNSSWIERIEQLSGAIREIGAFREIGIETLREDWHDKRKEAQLRIRQFVARGSREGEVLVVPFRVYGPGPLESVLAGLEYRADGRALLPHPNVTTWLMQEASQCFRQKGWVDPFEGITEQRSLPRTQAEQRF